MLTAVAIAVAGALGALARYGLDTLISRRVMTDFPWGTFAVNITGSFVLGVVIALTSERFEVEPWLRTGLAVGLLGAYTTFSTLSFQTYRLIGDGSYGPAVAYSLGSLAAGTAALYAGIVLARAV
jgi:fluoride exporter